ncbi:MAG: hypothetical protein JWM80_1137 [Cyanobacteria bacterium RYN_339]|nr:hypothetical protein [Cyanobacteria bacterium RYN_339]
MTDVSKRWKVLRDAAAPVLSAPALVVAIALAFSLAMALALQFGTNLYDQRAELAYVHAGLNALLALGLGVMMLLRPTWQRAHMIMLGVALAVILGSLWAAGAKLQFRRSQVSGNAFYSLPHQPFRYEEPAVTVWIRTADNVQLACTLISHKRTRAVVFYPGWRTNRDAFAVATLAQWLANTVDVLVVDPRGQGESEGAKTPDGQEKQDVLAAVGYMRSTGHPHVGVLAEEDAALPAVQAATLHEGIESLALVSPAAVWGESLGQDGRFFDPHGLFGRLYWRVAAGLRLASGQNAPPLTDAIRFVAPTPILITGTKPQAGSTIDQLHLAAGEPKSLIVLGGEGKPVTWTHFAEYYKTLEGWYDITLRAVVPVEPTAGP